MTEDVRQDAEPPEIKSPPLPQWAIDAADRMKRFFVPVPLSDAEKGPDPDYGF